MLITIRNTCSDVDSYRAARVKSLFNCESGADFAADHDLPIDDADWRIGLVVGPSGTGKSSIARALWPDVPEYAPAWAPHRPIIDEIAPGGSFDAVPAALAAVGLGSVAAWLRPHHVLSNGEQFRATLARLLAEAPARAKVDEFTSVVDRQVAQIGAMAFGKAWRRTGGQVVLFTCHYDVADWLQPDWILDTADGSFARGSLRRRPAIELEIRRVDWSHWRTFEPHHYLKLPRMIAAYAYVGSVDGRPIAHLGVGTRPGMREARAARLVVMPEWQGVGIGRRFLNAICGAWLAGDNPPGRPMPTLLNTSHPGLAAALRRDPCWTQISAAMHGQDKTRSRETIVRAATSKGATGYGGHFRAIQGFRYYGE
jgi:GNAT superfamily N-acetyltransferase